MSPPVGYGRSFVLMYRKSTQQPTVTTNTKSNPRKTPSATKNAPYFETPQYTTKQQKTPSGIFSWLNPSYFVTKNPIFTLYNKEVKLFGSPAKVLEANAIALGVAAGGGYLLGSDILSLPAVSAGAGATLGTTASSAVSRAFSSPLTWLTGGLLGGAVLFGNKGGSAPQNPSVGQNQDQALVQNPITYNINNSRSIINENQTYTIEGSPNASIYGSQAANPYLGLTPTTDITGSQSAGAQGSATASETNFPWLYVLLGVGAFLLLDRKN
jgi:hypothetical protein